MCADLNIDPEDFTTASIWIKHAAGFDGVAIVQQN